MVPKSHYGYHRVQADTYKDHYRGLYGQPRLYLAKTTYLGQIWAFKALFSPYRSYIEESYRI